MVPTEDESGHPVGRPSPMDRAVEVRVLDQAELPRVGEIDRTEHIDVLYDQHGTELVARPGSWASVPWDPTGHGEHSVDAKVRELQGYLDAGGVALGAFVGDQLLGIGVVVPHLRPTTAQLAFLHVTAARRATGVGSLLSDQLEQIARAAGDTEMVVSATPSGNTVRFYLGRGFRPTAEPLPELVEAEPEDIQLHKAL